MATKEEVRNLKNSALTQKELNSLKQQGEINSQKSLENLRQQNDALNDLGLKAKDLNDIYIKINSEKIKSIELDKKQKAEKLALLQIELKRAGLTKSEINTVIKVRNFTDKTSNNIQNTLKNSKLLAGIKNIPFIGQIAGMGEDLTVGLIKGINGIGKFVQSGIVGFSKLRQFGSLLFSKEFPEALSMGMALIKAILANTGVLAVFAAITAGIYAIQTAFKFNIGNVAGIFGSMMAKLQAMWAVFELKVVKGLGGFSGVFSSVFQGIADTVIFLSEMFFELAGAFGSAFSFGNDADSMASSLGNLFKAIQEIFRFLMPTLKAIAFVLGVVTKLALDIIGLFGDIIAGFMGMINAALDSLASLLPDWAQKWLGFGSAAKAPEIAEAGSGGTTNNMQQANNVNINVSGNMDKETAEMVVARQNATLPNLAKMNSLNPI